MSTEFKEKLDRLFSEEQKAMLAQMTKEELDELIEVLTAMVQAMKTERG